MRIRVLPILFTCLSHFVFAQSSHPETLDPGCCSERTGLPYSYNPKNDENLYTLYETNKISEKSLFYFGKYDAWKSHHNKKNPLFEQIYIIPPGTLPIAKGVFLDQTEVANIHYDEFLHFIAQDSAQYTERAYMPSLDNKYKNKYYNNTEFYFFPVTGVRQEHAEAYCQWRAKKLNILIKEMLIGSPKKYRYQGRLPKLNEWQKAAGEATEHVKKKNYNIGKTEIAYLQEEVLGNRFVTSSALETKHVNGLNANFLVEQSGSIEIEIPSYVYSFEPNERGFYNLYGNVKELVQEGYAIGGSFLTPYEPEKLYETGDDIQAYRMDVGFRCIVEVARRKLR